MNQLISIIVPVYNVFNYLHRCVESLLTQSYSCFEILLIDDGSTDGSAALCDELACIDQRIRVFHKLNGGLSDARNYGLAMSKGDLVTFVDSDDIVHRDYLRVMYEDLTQYDCDIAVTCIQSWRDFQQQPDLRSLKAGKAEELSKEEALESVLYDRVSISSCGKLYKKHLFDNVSFPIGKHYEDVLTTIQVILKCSTIVIRNTAYYYYYMRENSISHESLTEKSFDRFSLAEIATSLIQNEYGDFFDTATTRYQVVHALSVMRLHSEDDSAYLDRLHYLETIVRSNRIKILTDSKASLRDKAGVFASMMGRNVYLFSWKLYSMFTGRQN